MNGNEFFIRFNLQRSSGVFYDEGFPFWKFLDYTEDETNKFVSLCNSWIEEQANALNAEMDLSSVKGKSVLFVGDSITADRFSYRAILQKTCNFEGMNAAISGATSADMVRFIHDNIKASKPDIISILIGANDSLLLDKTNAVISKEEFEKNISIILDKSVKSGADVIVGTPACIDEKVFNEKEGSGWRSNTNKNIDCYADIVRQKAKEYGVMLFDVNSIVKGLDDNAFIEDGVHLKKETHSMLAENWLNVLLTGI